MRILIVKTSSLGDIIHMLPSITEAIAHIPGLEIDWVVEEGFQSIPLMHPNIRRVIPVAIRRWRKTPFSSVTRKEFGQFITSLRSEKYDWVIDTQGLIKSLAIDLIAHGKRGGYDFASARDPLVSLFFQKRVHAPRKKIPAIQRNRMIMAEVLGYALDSDEQLRYGITPPPAAPNPTPSGHYLVAFHGTARAEKEYPVIAWKMLISGLRQAGYPVLLPWGNHVEKLRAEMLSEAGGMVLPKRSLPELAAIIAHSDGVVGVDTGLMHLAGALRKPGLGLFPATDPELYGVKSESGAPLIRNLSRPEDLDPEHVVHTLLRLLP